MQRSVPNSMNWTRRSIPKHHWPVSEAFHVQNCSCWSTFAAAKAADNSRRTNVRILTLLVIFSLFQNMYLAEPFYWYGKISDLHSVYGSFFFKNTLINYLKIIFWSYSLFLPWLPQISAPTVSTQLCVLFSVPWNVVGLWRAMPLEKANSSVSTAIVSRPWLGGTFAHTPSSHAGMLCALSLPKFYIGCHKLFEFIAVTAQLCPGTALNTDSLYSSTTSDSDHLSAPLQQHPWALAGGGVVQTSHLKQSTPQSLIIYAATRCELC